MLLPCIWISEFNRIHQYITTRNIQWPVITSLCNANEWCFLWFPSMTDIPLWPPLAGSHRRKSENPHKRDICSSPQWYCWKKSCTSWKKDDPFIPLFTRFMYPRWCRISSINSISDGIWHLYNKHTHTSRNFWQLVTTGYILTAALTVDAATSVFNEALRLSVQRFYRTWNYSTRRNIR